MMLQPCRPAARGISCTRGGTAQLQQPLQPVACSRAAALQRPGPQLQHSPGGVGDVRTAAVKRQAPAAKLPKGGAPSRPEADQEEDVEEGEDGFLDEDMQELEADENVYEDGEGEDDGEGEEADDQGATVLGLEADDTQPGVETGGVGWAEAALRATNKVLALPSLSNLELYVFRALPGGKLDIRLDRLDDKYGSPSIDDIEKFSRMFFLELEAEVGVEAAGDVALEVSSPGAERTLRLPEDLNRFGGLPLMVERLDQDGKRVSNVLVLDDLDLDAGSSIWHMADVRANATTKGRGLSKRQRELKLAIPLANISMARVHVDF